MGERPVPHVMKERRHEHEHPVFFTETKLPACDTGQVHRTHRVFKTGVVGPGIHQVGEPELPNVAQSLNGRGIKERQDLFIDFHIAMDRVLDDLGIH